jgi:asparagine synthase (glutamine-hydrolysing)
MCGIAGIFLLDSANKDKLKSIKKMTDVLTHRGPNDEGFYFKDKIGLGHRRLNIIDLSANAKQPMFNEDHSLVLVFNGEIYNFQELRKDLIKKGHTFKSQSDSEVILHLYEEHQTDCTKYLEGMFAFAIYDIKREKLFLARDRLGEKPLYYYKTRNGFYFSSEIKSFFMLDDFEKKISSEGLHTYFNNIQIPAPQTIFEGVKKIRPAHGFLLDSRGHETEKPYWKVDCTKKTKLSIGDAKEQLNLLMLDSVKKMLVSDVPIGLLLSGGVDSSLLLALANEAGMQGLSTFTVGNSSKGLEDEEFKRAKKIASKFNSKNYAHDFGKTEFNQLVEAAKVCDEPIGILEIFYLFGIFGKIKDHAKVLLSGNGADEIFGGYVTYSNVKKYSNFTSPFNFLIQHSNALLTSTAASMNSASNWKILKNLFSVGLNKSRPKGLEGNLLSEAMSLVTYDNVLDAKLFMDLFVRCNHAISSIPDTGGMSYFVEVRSPFLHHKIIEFAATLPSNYKIQDHRNPLTNKSILKQLACDYLNSEDVYIQKYGFGYFINSFTLMKTAWKNNIEDTIFDSVILKTCYFNEGFVRDIWVRFLNDKLNFRERLIFARFVMFCVWYKYNFVVSGRNN